MKLSESYEIFYVTGSAYYLQLYSESYCLTGGEDENSAGNWTNVYNVKLFKDGTAMLLNVSAD